MQMEGHYFVLTGSAMKELLRLIDDAVFEELSTVVGEKYPSQFTRDSVERGDVWVFEAKPRTPLVDQIVRGA